MYFCNEILFLHGEMESNPLHYLLLSVLEYSLFGHFLEANSHGLRGLSHTARPHVGIWQSPAEFSANSWHQLPVMRVSHLDMPD